MESHAHNTSSPIRINVNLICISMLRHCRSISHRQWRTIQQHGENHITVTKCNTLGV